MDLVSAHNVGLNHRQKLEIEQLLRLEQSLKSPEPPSATKGLEGMEIAHAILQKREAVGVLIGGLAEAVWSPSRKPEDLAKHKDVDVAVLTKGFKLEENFEGGIDWWMPQTGEISIRGLYQPEMQKKTWYKNGNGVILRFGIHKDFALAPGLYIPSPEWLLDMREYEAEASLDWSQISVDEPSDVDHIEAVFEEFKTKVRRKVKKRVPEFIGTAFKGYILSQPYERNPEKLRAVGLEKFDLQTVRQTY
jgi:hypothetical protein